MNNVTGKITPMVAAAARPTLVRSIWLMIVGLGGTVWLGLIVYIMVGEGLG